jgi:hypothetical protein
MTREQLEHAIRAACDVAEDSELYVFGSQAILGSFPQAPHELRGSIEIDVQPKNRPEATDKVDGALGELSRFHATFGFYVHGVSLESAMLPEGWQGRTVAVCDPIGTRGNTGHCVEAHDLAASKLFAYREKDRDFVRVLLAAELIDAGILIERITALAIPYDRKAGMERWVRATVEDLGKGP